MSFPLHFPDFEVLRNCIINNPLLNMYDKGIVQAIAEIAAARFANTDFPALGLNIGVAFTIFDYQASIGIIPNVSDFGLFGSSWNLIAMATEQALVACANHTLPL